MITEYTDICFICGKPKEEIHHLVFGRGMRELADADGLTAPMCHDCHEKLHKQSGDYSKIIGQLEYEIERVERGIPRAIAREQFRKRYGRSYL